MDTRLVPMFCFGTSQSASNARVERVLSGGQPGWTTDFIATVDGGPQAFLVEQSAGGVVRPHFHLQDQFQVILRGNGTLGRHNVQPLQVHYANRHTGYGPIAAGQHGLAYLTLRQISDAGAWYLPESRPYLDLSMPKRLITSPSIGLANEEELAHLVSVETAVLIAAEGEGPAAWRLRLPPGGITEIPGPMGGSGSFCVVTCGEVELRGYILQSLAVAFLQADGASLKVRAGASGTEILLAQFPATDEQNGDQ